MGERSLDIRRAESPLCVKATKYLAPIIAPTSVAALVQADLSLPPYIDMPVGSFISITDYSASGKGGTFQKISIAGGDQTDWVVFSTEDRTVTGGTGTTPIV